MSKAQTQIEVAEATIDDTGVPLDLDPFVVPLMSGKEVKLRRINGEWNVMVWRKGSKDGGGYTTAYFLGENRNLPLAYAEAWGRSSAQSADTKFAAYVIEKVKR